MSAATLLAAIVIERRLGDPGGREFDLWRTGQTSKYSRWTPTRPTWRAVPGGVMAGAKHPAGLNYGDCFSDALAATHGEPLLFKGDDFTKTDVKVCP